MKKEKIEKKGKRILKVQSLEVEPQLKETNYSPMYQGTATNKLATVSSKNLVIDEVFDNAIIEENGLKVFFENHNKVKAKLRVSTQKLLDMGIIYLTKTNNYKESDINKINTGVNIPLKDYAYNLGYDIQEKPTNTPEEEKKEKARIKSLIDKLRNKVNEDLTTLYSMSLSWTEPKGDKKGTSLDYKDIRILQSKAVKKGIIQIRFTQEIAHYLNHAYITQYPMQLLSIDERNPIVYQVGYKLVIHGGMLNNKQNKTQGIIGVKSLLNATSEIVKWEDLKEKDSGHWERRIKEPLEKALDKLVEKRVIEFWEYSNSKGVPLDDRQITIDSYNAFEPLYIKFKLIK